MNTYEASPWMDLSSALDLNSGLLRPSLQTSAFASADMGTETTRIIRKDQPTPEQMEQWGDIHDLMN